MEIYKNIIKFEYYKKLIYIIFIIKKYIYSKIYISLFFHTL